jgi:hypothetical protein
VDFFKEYYVVKRHINLELINTIKDADYYQIEDEAAKAAHCYADGKYCADPMTSCKRQLTLDKLKVPKHTIVEGISQECIFNAIEQKSEHSQSAIFNFVEYLEQIRDTCLSKANLLECTSRLRAQSADFMITADNLQSCINKALKANHKGLIPYLEKKKKLSNFHGYHRVPSIFLEGNLVRGEKNAEVALGAICDGFKKRPKMCKRLHLAVKKEMKLERLYKSDLVSNRHTLAFLAIFVVMLLLLCVFYYGVKKLYLKDILDSMNRSAEHAVQQYRTVQVRQDDGL